MIWLVVVAWRMQDSDPVVWPMKAWAAPTPYTPHPTDSLAEAITPN